MNDLISRQAAIDGRISVERANGVEIYSDEAVPVEYLKHLPSAEPERKRGKWLMAGEDEREQIIWVECSECGQALSWKSNYCPNCGADMRGEEDEGFD